MFQSVRVADGRSDTVVSLRSERETRDDPKPKLQYPCLVHPQFSHYCLPQSRIPNRMNIRDIIPIMSGPKVMLQLQEQVNPPP